MGADMSKRRAASSLLIYKYGVAKPRPKLRIFSTSSVALAMHRKMYQAFAAGDLSTLRAICAEGLLASFATRIQSRPANERLTWTLHRYSSFARVVSDRAARLPVGDDTCQRQAIVRIRSSQSLTRFRKEPGRLRGGGGAGAGAGAGAGGGGGGGGHADSRYLAVSGTGAEKELLEYFVIQRRHSGGVEGPWMVWGTTGETTVETLDERERIKRGDA
ncbi:MAG: hypothetical protein M1826_001133 [Phylliscum demangeonii]|nr:MAG: hypothetical protein M1826_001133 [Phylliscum demangeonii]